MSANIPMFMGDDAEARHLQPKPLPDKTNEKLTSSVAPPKPGAVAFFECLLPQGPWCLAAFAPGEAPEVQTFRPGAQESMADWIKARDGKKNLHFQVNPVGQDLRRKAKKDDILHVAVLHCDLDPNKGTDRNEERERIRALIECPPEGIPAPTAYLDSGNGYQAFWKLREPLSVDEGEARNRALVAEFGGDSCWDASRLMRIPGTINIPNKAKQKRGYTECQSVLIGLHTERVFDSDRFPEGKGLESRRSKPSVQKAAAGAGHRATGQGGEEDVEQLISVDELPVGDRVKAAIEHGPDPANPLSGDNSRSGWLFYVLCELARAGVEDSLMRGIILDPGFAISEHVLEQRNSKRYALRQVDRAKDAVEDFDKYDDGTPKKTQRNIRLAVARLGHALSHDAFASRLLIDGKPLDDSAVTRMYLQTEAQFKFRAGKEYFWMVVEDEARRNSFHPVRDYLEALSWDGVERLDRWLVNYGNAEDSAYVRAVGSLVLIAAVRRVRRPGCKFDEMLVLESPQGQFKSTALRTLAVEADWFSDDLPLNADTKRQIEALAGRWIVEAGELKGMRRGDVEHLKSFLSRCIDRARLAYGRLVKEVPRQCVIIGTTNSERYLRDNTGNRRFWPVRVGKFDLAGLKADRDQLWAEAVTRERKGDAIRLDPALWSAAGIEQAERRVEDPWLLELGTLLSEKKGKIRAKDVWEIVGVPKGQRTQEHNARLGDAMKELGWRPEKRRFGGLPEQAYVRGAKHESLNRIWVTKNALGEVFLNQEPGDADMAGQDPV